MPSTCRRRSSPRFSRRHQRSRLWSAPESAVLRIYTSCCTWLPCPVLLFATTTCLRSRPRGQPRQPGRSAPRSRRRGDWHSDASPRKAPCATSQAGHLAAWDHHHPAEVVGDLFRIDPVQTGIATGKLQPIDHPRFFHKPEGQNHPGDPRADRDELARWLGSTCGALLSTVETSSTRSCRTRLCRRWWVSPSGMPVLAAVKIAAAPGRRRGGLVRTHWTNSSSCCRRWERCCSSSSQPVRQVSIKNAPRPRAAVGTSRLPGAWSRSRRRRSGR